MREKQRMTFVTRDVLQRAKADLEHMAEARKPPGKIPEKVTRPHLIRALRGEIRALLKRGYSAEDVIALLGQLGIQMDAETFRRCWRQARSARQTFRSKPEVSQQSS